LELYDSIDAIESHHSVQQFKVLFQVHTSQVIFSSFVKVFFELVKKKEVIWPRLPKTKYDALQV
jgi:hypothetical protein